MAGNQAAINTQRVAELSFSKRAPGDKLDDCVMEELKRRLSIAYPFPDELDGNPCISDDSNNIASLDGNGCIIVSGGIVCDECQTVPTPPTVTENGNTYCVDVPTERMCVSAIHLESGNIITVQEQQRAADGTPLTDGTGDPVLDTDGDPLIDANGNTVTDGTGDPILGPVSAGTMADLVDRLNAATTEAAFTHNGSQLCIEPALNGEAVARVILCDPDGVASSISVDATAIEVAQPGDSEVVFTECHQTSGIDYSAQFMEQVSIVGEGYDSYKIIGRESDKLTVKIYGQTTPLEVCLKVFTPASPATPSTA